jgi:hypothetical protein
MNDLQTTTPGDPAMVEPLTDRTFVYQFFGQAEAPDTWMADAAYPADSLNSPVPYTLTAKAETLLGDAGSPTTAAREADAGGMTAHDPHADSGLFRQPGNYIAEISVPPSDGGIHRLFVRMNEPEPEPEAGPMTGSEPQGRDVTDNAFYEWMLSDHPDARAERDRQRTATYQADADRAAAVRTWADKIGAQPDAPQHLRDLAATMGPLADQAAARAEARYAEPDDAYVTRLRAQHETHMQVSGPPGSPDYRYPAHLTGPGAAAYPPPPQPDIAAREPEAGA